MGIGCSVVRKRYSAAYPKTLTDPTWATDRGEGARKSLVPRTTQGADYRLFRLPTHLTIDWGPYPTLGIPSYVPSPIRITI